MNKIKLISLKIAKEIFAAIILKDEEAFKKYLEDHPNYREGTIFIVDGVERKAPPKKKKTTSYKEDELKTINGVFNGAFRALEGKGYKINELTPEQTERFHNMLNGILEKNKIRPLSKEEFKEMFISEVNKRFPKKEEKKEDSIFGDTEKILSDMKKTGKRIVGHPIENHHSINRKFVFQHSLCKSIFKPVREPTEPINEEMAYRLDKILGFGLVPPTITSNKTTDKGVEFGSEQMIVENATFWNDSNFNDDFFTTPSRELENFKTRIEQMAVFDFLISNNDRHNENFMFDKNQNIFCIDNGLLSSESTDNYVFSCAISIAHNLFKEKNELKEFIKNHGFYNLSEEYCELEGDESVEFFKKNKVKFNKTISDSIKKINSEKVKILFDELGLKADGILERIKILKEIFK